MATILEFRPQGRDAGLTAMGGGRASASAEIVFFPGVRYERWSAQPAPKQRRRLKKRDKIEVNE